MKTSTRCVVCALLLFGAMTPGCKDGKKDGKGAHSSSSPSPTKEAHQRPRLDHQALGQDAKVVVGKISELEARKDVTCWTSFRQLDSFIATKQYSDPATLAKIKVVKDVTLALWLEAGTRGSLDGVPAWVATPDASFEKAKADYQTTSEHWRVVLSVMEDLFGDVTLQKKLPRLSEAELGGLADRVTIFSLHLLASSGRRATYERSPQINGQHVTLGAKELVTQNPWLIPHLEMLAGHTRAAPSDQATKARVALTGMVIDAKVKALLSYNKGGDVSGALERVSRMPLTPQAKRWMLIRLKSFVRFVASGYEPMRGDNYLSDGSFEPSTLARRDFPDAVWVENSVMQVFPHVMHPNGDILLRFEPNPGTLGAIDRQGFDLKMLDYEQNAVRDTAVHWLALADVHRDAPFALDPFGAEYLSEVASMMMTAFLRRGEALAKQMGKAEIDEDVVKQIQSPLYVQVMPKEALAASTVWGRKEEAKKAQALIPYATHPLFKDVTLAWGLPDALPKIHTADFSALHGIAGDIQRVMGSGIGVGDVNQDGFPDLYLAGEGLGKLYINKGAKGAGKFVEKTRELGLPQGVHDGRSALFFDQDGDGDLDLLLVRSHHPSMLFRWDGQRFEDVTKAAGIATTNGAHVAAVFDANGDGMLDIFVGYYGSKQVNENPERGRNLPSIDGKNGSPAQLWVATKGGTYTEQAQAFGLADTGWSLAASAFDGDGDGDIDLMVANDFGANSQYENQGGGKFLEVAASLGTDDRGSGMNVDVSDLNLDGRPDVYVTNVDMFSKSVKIVFPVDGSLIPLGADTLRTFQYITGNKLYVSGTGQAYTSQEQDWFEPGDRGWAWDGNFFDYDNDGDDDLYLANGWIEGSYAHNQVNQMFLQHDGVFVLGPQGSAERFGANSRAVAAVDLDRDGDLDLVVNQFRQPPRVLENVQSQPNQAIVLKLRAKAPNTRAVGSKVEVWWGGKLRHTEEVRVGRGYLSQDDPDQIHLGVGRQNQVEVRVRWPGVKKPTLIVWKRGESDTVLEAVGP